MCKYEYGKIDTNFCYVECPCTSNGTKHGNCHPTTGQCSCKIGLTGKNCTNCAIGFTGDNCDSCTPGYDHYGYPDCRKLGHKSKLKYFELYYFQNYRFA